MVEEVKEEVTELEILRNFSNPVFVGTTLFNGISLLLKKVTNLEIQVANLQQNFNNKDKEGVVGDENKL